MAGERRRLMGELAAWHVATILGAFGGKPINPAELNPYREPTPPTAATERLARWKKKRKWAAFLAGVSRGSWRSPGSQRGAGGEQLGSD